MPCMTARTFGFSIASMECCICAWTVRSVVDQSLRCVSKVPQEEEVHFVSAFLQKQRDSGR